MKRPRIVAICLATVLGLVLDSSFSGAGPPDPSEGSEGARRVGVDFSDSTEWSNAATAVTPRVYGSASPDSIPGRYRYAVTLVNEASSRNTVWKFVLDPVPRPITVTPPPNWMWAYGYDLRGRALAFGSEGDDAPYPASWDSVSAVRSTYDLQPGDSVTFRFVSDSAPSMVHFYVQGFNYDSLGTEDQGGLPPYSVYNNSVTGEVIGPAATVAAPSTPGPHEFPPVPKAPPPSPDPIPRSQPRFVAPLAALHLPDGSAGTSPAADFGTLQMPGTGLNVSDSIDGLDFFVDSLHNVHVAWLAILHDNRDAGATKSELWYRRMEPERGAWSEPVLVASGEQLPLRILGEGGRIHLLVGRKIKHYLSADGGRTWATEGDVSALARIQSFDAIQVGGDILIAYLMPVRRTFGSQAPESVAVWVARWPARGAADAVRVGAHPGVSQVEPKLLVAGTELHLFYAVNRIGRGAQPDRVDANVFHARSGDRGVSWSTPRTIATLGLQGGESRKAGNGSVSHLDAVRLDHQLLVFYNAAWIYGTRSRDGEDWEEARAVIGVRTWLGSAATSSVAAAGDGRGGQLIWIDDRFQRTDRTALNPLGLPWFLDADWANNDVLAAPLETFAQPTEDMISAEPLRLTRELSFAGWVRAKASGGRVYALWSGRARVGKHLESANRPPAIFYRSLGISDRKAGAVR